MDILEVKLIVVDNKEGEAAEYIKNRNPINADFTGKGLSPKFKTSPGIIVVDHDAQGHQPAQVV